MDILSICSIRETLNKWLLLALAGDSIWWEMSFKLVASKAAQRKGQLILL